MVVGCPSAPPSRSRSRPPRRSPRWRRASCGCSCPSRCPAWATSTPTPSRTATASRWSTRACPARCRGRRCWPAWSAAGIPMNRVHHVIVTHSHPDHFGGAGMLAQESGAEVVASSYFRTWYDDRREQAGEPELDWRLNDEEPTRPSSPASSTRRPGAATPASSRTSERASFLARRREVRTGSPRPGRRCTSTTPTTWRLGRREWVGVHTPGHTNDHLCLFDQRPASCSRATTCCPTITPAHLRADRGRPAAGLPRLARQGRRLRGRRRRCCPPTATRSPTCQGRVDAIKAHHEERLSHAAGGVARPGLGRRSPTSCEPLFRERSWGHMAESETFAHLEHLRLSGQAERREEGGYLLYLAS